MLNDGDRISGLKMMDKKIIKKSWRKEIRGFLMGDRTKEVFTKVHKRLISKRRK